MFNLYLYFAVKLFIRNFCSICIFFFDRNSIGFIAQEVEQYFPNAVKTYKNKFLLQKGETEEENIYEEIKDFKSLDIDQLIKCLFGSVKYLQNQVKNLVQKNETLEQRIAKLE